MLDVTSMGPAARLSLRGKSRRAGNRALRYTAPNLDTARSESAATIPDLYAVVGATRENRGIPLAVNSIWWKV